MASCLVTDWRGFDLRAEFAQMAVGSGGRFLVTDIVEALDQGRMQAWLSVDHGAVDCLMVTELIRYPRLTTLRYIAAVGRFPTRWLRFARDIENQARAMGCDRLEAMAPRRWSGLLRALGWSEFHVLSEKPL